MTATRLLAGPRNAVQCGVQQPRYRAVPPPAMSRNPNLPRMTRRSIVVATLGGVTAPAWLAAAERRRPLARMTDGPFYPSVRWRADNPINRSDWDADLTLVRSASPGLRARGEHLGLGLLVVDSQDRRIDGALVEIWQCDALSAYRHPDSGTAPEQFDPGFQGFGAARSAADGSLAFRTIRPVPYPGRTPHIHLKLRHASFGELTTQLFVAGDPGNPRDFLWRSLPVADRDPLALQLQPGGDDGLRWQARHALVVPA